MTFLCSFWAVVVTQSIFEIDPKSCSQIFEFNITPSQHTMNQQQADDPFTCTVNEALITALCEGCKEGDLDLVQEILQDGTVEVDDVVDENYWAPLHHAVYGGQLEVVQYLVENKGQDVNALNCTDEGQEAIQFAATDGHLDVVKYLVKHGQAGIMDIGNELNRRPLHFASLGGNFEMVRFLVETCNVVVNATDDDDWSALHFACMGGDLQIVRFLAKEHKLDCNATGADGWGPLHCAVSNGNTEIAKYLLGERDASAYVLVGDVNENLLHLAVSEGHLDTVNFLVEECGFHAREITSDSDTALHVAARYGQLRIIQYLLKRLDPFDRRCLIASRNATYQTAHDIATKCVEAEDVYSNLEVVECLSSFANPGVYMDAVNPDTCYKRQVRVPSFCSQ